MEDFIRLRHISPYMSKKLYTNEALDPSWGKAIKASERYGQLRNHRPSTKKNDSRGALWIAGDFTDMGVNGPEKITQQNWLDLVERYRNGETRSGNILKEGSIRKRKEALVQILKALRLDDVLHFVTMWKEKKEGLEIRWWNDDETEAMNQFSMRLFSEPNRMKHCIAHLIHFHIAPRREDTAAFKWKYIDLNAGIITFKASKNDNRCVSFIEDRFLPMLREYKAFLKENGHGEEYLFPASNSAKSGTTKVHRPHITGKTIGTWLEKIRDGTLSIDGTPIRKYSSHCYRHTLAMRFLNSGSTYEDVSRVLGDLVATIEEHYAELGFTDSFRKAWKAAHVRSSMKTTIGTAQPEWLDSFRGVRTQTMHRLAAAQTMGSDTNRVADVPGFEPGFSA